MTDPYKYRSISLKNKTYSKLENLSNVVVKGTKLSNAKTVEKLINDRVNNSDSRPENRLEHVNMILSVISL